MRRFLAVLFCVAALVELRASGARAQSRPYFTEWSGAYYAHGMMLIIYPNGYVEFQRICASCFVGYSTVDSFILTSVREQPLDDQFDGPGFPVSVEVASTDSDQVYAIGNGVMMLSDPTYLDGVQAFCSASTDSSLLPPALAAQNVCRP